MFLRNSAGALARTHRGLVTTEWTKSKRRGVLIDSNQNGEGKTIASAYSVRPKLGAPVLTGESWSATPLHGAVIVGGMVLVVAGTLALLDRV